MNSRVNLVYITAALAALVLGLGVSFWRSAAENKQLSQANLAAGMALAAAQDEAKVLREKLDREAIAREYAEAAQTVAEHSEHTTREKLAQETRAHQAAEAALLQAAAELQTTTARLANEQEARRSMETAWQQAEFALVSMTAQLNDEMSAKQAAEAALVRFEDQVRLLDVRLPALARGKKAETAASGGPVETLPPGAESQDPAGPSGTRENTQASNGNRITEARGSWRAVLTAE